MLVKKTAKGLHSILSHYYNIGNKGSGGGGGERGVRTDILCECMSNDAKQMMPKLEFFPRVLSKIEGVGGEGHHGNYCTLSLAVPMPCQCLANVLPMSCPYRRDPLLYPSSNLQYRTMQK